MGAFGEVSKDLAGLINDLASARAKYEARAAGKPLTDGRSSLILQQYRRLLSTSFVRSQAVCLLTRMGLLSEGTKAAANRRELMMSEEHRLRKERKSHWLANIRGMGLARKGVIVVP